MNDILLTHIDPPQTVFSEAGRRADMVNRKFYGLSLCLSGQITYTLEGRDYISAPGTALWLPKGGTYRLYGNKEGLFPLLNFDCMTAPWEGMRLIALNDEAECLRRWREVQEQYDRGGSALGIRAAVYGLLGAVFREQNALPAPLDAACRLIDQRLSDPDLSNTAIAARLGISEVYLRKLFAAHLGTSPRQYLLDMRIRKARRLLEESALNVSEVALESGFSGPYHFCRTFKERTALTPTQYAKAHRIYKI